MTLAAVLAFSACGLWAVDTERHGKIPSVVGSLLLSLSIWVVAGSLAMGVFQ